MPNLTNHPSLSVVERAAQSAGRSSAPIYRLVAETLRRCHSGGGSLLDVGCGSGGLWPWIDQQFDHYIGADVMRFEGFPPAGSFHHLDAEADSTSWNLPTADVVAALETIEHVENPRAFFRGLVRFVRPGGWLIVTTPNQLSWLSKLCLMLKNEFVHFQERPGLYPAHLSALLEVDLLRMARESCLDEPCIRWTAQGRIPGTPWHWPRWLSAERGWRGRAFSDNVLLVARRPGGESRA